MLVTAAIESIPVTYQAGSEDVVMSPGTQSTQNVIGPSARRRVTNAVIAGVVGAFLGAVLGGIVGADIGGNWFTSFSLAGQRGYEATSLIGAVVGAVAFTTVGLWLALRRRRTM
jgi:uncharacterized membrane protein YeaQ/YmgE (transglycosylase-associated protein family)